MTRSPRSRVGVLAVSLLLVAATVGAGAVAGGPAASGTFAHSPAVTAHATTAEPAGGPATVGSGANPTEGLVDPLTGCFTGSGYPISIGGDEGGAAMEAVLHFSVLTDPAAGNEFGVETAGRLDGEQIVTLAAGVRLTARQAVADGIDPFAAFDVLYTYELRLPMFDGAVGDVDYENDGSPIGSSAGAVAC
jgi:hypothetical protein